jgi:arylformamidase
MEAIVPISSRTIIHDITVSLSPGLPVWPGDPAIEFRPLSRTANGDSANTTQIICPTHCGTHVDPPWHFIDDRADLDAVPIERWVGPCQVVELPAGIDVIDPADLEAVGIARETTRLLLKTTNSAKWKARPLVFETDYVALSPAGAHWIVERGLELIGIDYLSFETYTDTESEVHRTILGHGIVAIEGLDLSNVAPGFYELVCLPLKVAHGDGAPARVILLDYGAQ